MNRAFHWRERENDEVTVVITVGDAVIAAVTTYCSLKTMGESFERSEVDDAQSCRKRKVKDPGEE